MVVDYAANGNVCRIRIPAMGPDDKRSGVTSTNGIDDFILKLLPMASRGKELRCLAEITGLRSSLTVEHENVGIVEEAFGGERTGVTVTLVGEKCKD